MYFLNIMSDFDFDELVRSNKEQLLLQIEFAEDYAVDLRNLYDKQKEAWLVALTQALESDIAALFYNANGKYLILRLQYNDIRDGRELENMYYISSRTLDHIRKLIKVLRGELADTTDDFTESDQAILFGLLSLNGFALEWYDYKRPQKAGGYFPYYNLNEDLDLSIFGIYHPNDNVDYSDNCFITAAINSKLFSNEEIEYMRSLINTRYLPRDDLEYFAKIFNVCIAISYYNDKRNKIDKAVRYGPKGEATRCLRLLLRCGHYMLYHDELVPENKYNATNLNTLITRMLAANDLQPISDISEAEKFIVHEYEYQHLEYSPLCIKQVANNEHIQQIALTTCAIFKDNMFTVVLNRHAETIAPYNFFSKIPNKTVIYMPDLKEIVNIIPQSTEYKITPIQYRKTIQLIKLTAKDKYKTVYLHSIKALTSIDSSSYDLKEFTKFVNTIRRIIREKLNINIDNYTSLPKLAFDAAYNYGCFANVFTLSGIIQAFAKKCIHGGLIKTMQEGMFSVNDVTCLDINSSYGTSMNTMPGIPIGKPKPFYDAVPNDSCYAFIQCNISNIRNDKLGRYSFVNEGIMFIDSILLDEIKKYVDCDITIINGYYFNEGFNKKINDFAKVLYDLRSLQGLNKFGKNMLSSLYGKTLQSSPQYKIEVIPKREISEYIINNGNFIYEIIKKNSCYVVKLMKSLNMNFNIPHMGIMVLSESRKRMNNIIDYCNDNNINIYSIKTDSFVIDSNKVNDIATINSIGTNLGEFKVEYIAKNIKYTSSSCYKAILIDDSIRMRGKVN